MNTVDRRKAIVKIIMESEEPLSGSALSARLGVSRQVIVQDVALLKAQGYEILSTNRGYILQNDNSYSRVLKVHHTNEQTEEELTCIVDLGGIVEDVFVWHKVYGKIEAKLNISSRRNVKQCVEGLLSGKSKALLNVTSGYHYHTIKADSEETLDLIEQELEQRHFLAPEI